jgi:hypothetical protein
LSLLKYLVDEHIPEPPAGFWTSLPGRVTSSTRKQQQRSYRLPVPVWAGGLAAAALLILLIITPWKGSRMDVRIPSEYFEQITGRFGMGLEDEILSISGLHIVELSRSLERDILFSDRLYGPDSLNDLYQTGLFEGMNDITLETFEKLIDEMSPRS